MIFPNLSQEANVFLLVLAGLTLLFVVFFIIYSIIMKNAYKNLLDKMTKSQEKSNLEAAELLASNLLEYTDVTLVEKVNDRFCEFFSNTLLPDVNNAFEKFSFLSETVVERQEKGMSELAEMLARLLAENTRDYIREESEIITRLNSSVSGFSSELAIITASTRALHEHYDSVYENAEKISSELNSTYSLLLDKVAHLSDTVNDIIQISELNQNNLSSNIGLVTALAETTTKIQDDYQKNAVIMLEQNAAIADKLSNCAASLQQNTEDASEKILSELNSCVGSVAASISESIVALEGVSDKIALSANSFNQALSETYQNFGSNINNQLSESIEALSQAVSLENQRLTSSAETYTDNFQASLNHLHSALDSHSSGIRDITEQLTNSIGGFKQDADICASRFEVGMDSSVNSALEQLDSALADIVKRLVVVTDNIQEAADSLPDAVRAMIDSRL